MCWFHHRTIDTSEWGVRMLSGVPHIRPPAGLDSGGGRRAVTKSPTRLADQRKRHAGHASSQQREPVRVLLLPVLQGPDAALAEAVIWVSWGLFAIDYVVNLWLAPRRWRWFYTHLFDLAIVVLPMPRPLRLLRLVTILAVLQRTAGAAFRGRVIIYVAGATLLLVWVAALAVLDAERGHDGSIQTLRDGLWWAFVTVTTVGYGDYFPVTPTGSWWPSA